MNAPSAGPFIEFIASQCSFYFPFHANNVFPSRDGNRSRGSATRSLSTIKAILEITDNIGQCLSLFFHPDPLLPNSARKKWILVLGF